MFNVIHLMSANVIGRSMVPKSNFFLCRSEFSERPWYILEIPRLSWYLCGDHGNAGKPKITLWSITGASTWDFHILFGNPKKILKFHGVPM